MANLDVDAVLKKLTLTEKVELLSGIDFWHTKALPKHGIPSIRMSDGPNGVRGTRFFNGVPAACFPCGTALGSTFNQELLEQAGKTMGDEAIAKSAHLILGPTINMQRSPLGGRGFESIGEDPFLSGLGAAALVRGIQSTGVVATVKHFLCNDQEDKRMGVQSIVTERALREIYAMPLQIAVRDARPGAFMTAYNGINGTFCSENIKCLDDMLRKEWGWNGLIMSDWYGTYSTNDAIKAGLGLEMPGPSRFRGDALQFNVSTGKPFIHHIDDRVRQVLNLVKKVSSLPIQENGPETTLNTPETAALLRKIGNERIVLLKNDDNILPFSKEKKTLVLGPNAKEATYHGGGSAALRAYYAVTPLTASVRSSAASLPSLSVHIPTASCPFWETSSRTLTASVASIGGSSTSLTVMLIASNPKVNDVWYADMEGSLVADEDCTYEIGVVVSGTAKAFVNDQLIVDNATKQVAGNAFFGASTREERGRVEMKKGETYHFRIEFGSAPTFTLKGDAYVPGHGSLRVGGCKVIDDQQEIQKAVQLAREHDQVIICAGLNADWETEGADRASMKLPGVLDQLIAEVAAANPTTVVVMQTGTPEEMPWLSQTKAVLQAWYGGNETGNCIADTIFGDSNPSGKLSLSFPKRLQDTPAFLNFRTEAGRTLYGEDIYIGYRYYDLSNLSVVVADGKISATVRITNTGQREGAAVAQMYIQPKQPARINRPVKELRGFAKVELEAGASRTATISELEKYAAAYFDEERDQWCVEAGDYDVVVSDSSVVTDNTPRAAITVPETYWWSGI
ncbi:hypothetical protein ARSEF4850_001069 [Beauveria asiatica]